MSASKPPEPHSQELLDLPLSGRAPAAAEGSPPSEVVVEPENLDLFAGESLADEDVAEEDASDTPPAVPVAQPTVDEEVPLSGSQAVPRPVSRLDRLAGGVFDLAILLLVVALGLAITGVRGTDLPASAWAGPLGFLAVLSFVYFVFTLAFWGRTPGMATTRLHALAEDGDSLTGAQCVKRWLGSVATVLLVGIPVLVAPASRSLADRWSESLTARR